MGKRPVLMDGFKAWCLVVACGVVVAGVAGAQGPSITVTVSPSTVFANGVTTITGMVSNPTGATITGVSISLFGPTSLVIANPPNATNTCGGFTLTTAGSTTASQFLGSVPAGGTCEFGADFTASATGTDTIFGQLFWDPNNVANGQSTLKVSAPTATLSPAVVTAGEPVTIVMSFSGCTLTGAAAPHAAPTGGTTVLTIGGYFPSVTVPGANTSPTTIAFIVTLPPVGGTGGTYVASVTDSASGCNKVGGGGGALNGNFAIGAGGGPSNRTLMDTAGVGGRNSWNGCGSCHPNGLSEGSGSGTSHRMTNSLLTDASSGERLLNWSVINHEIHDFEQRAGVCSSPSGKGCYTGTTQVCSSGLCVGNPEDSCGSRAGACGVSAIGPPGSGWCCGVTESPSAAPTRSFVTPGPAFVIAAGQTDSPRLGGGIWRTTDQGKNWVNLGKTLPSRLEIEAAIPLAEALPPMPGVHYSTAFAALAKQSTAGSNLGEETYLADAFYLLGGNETTYVNTSPNAPNVHHDPGFFLPGRKLLLNFEASYNSQDAYTGPLGIGWTHTYNIFLIPNGANAVIKEADGQEIPFNGAGGGAFTPAIPGVLDSLVQNADSTYTLTRRNHVQLNFSAAGQLTSITEPNGNTQTLTYASGNLTTVTDNSGRTLTLTYDASNRVTQVSDPLARTVQFAYDALGRLISYTDPNGGVTQYAYDLDNRMIQETDPRGNTAISLVYDSQGRVISRTDALGFVTTYAYNTPSAGITTKTDPLGSVTLFAFDAQGRINSITNALGGVSSVTYDANNMILTSTDPRGNIWNYAYDASSDLTQATNPLGGVAKFTWDANFNLLTATDPLSHTTTYTYDAKNNLTQILNAAGGITTYTYDSTGLPLTYTNPNGVVTSYTYDSAGNLTQITDALGKIWKSTYDAAGRRLTATDPLSNTTTVAYDNLDNVTKVTDPLAHSTSYAYDANSNLTLVTDANLHTTQYAYDSRNQLTATTDALGDVANRAYDGNGNLNGYSDFAGHMMLYSYDKLNRRILTTDPLGNTNVNAYDADGNLTGLTDGNGKTNNFTYDSLNRQTGASLFDGSAIAYSYDADGDLTGMIDTTGTSTYAYDVLNRLTSATSGDGATVGFGYDAVGNRTSLTLPSLAVDHYTYDKRNQMRQAVDGAGAKTNYTYDAAGRLTAMTLANGALSSYKYDAASRLMSVVNKAAGAAMVSNFSYTFDAVGNKLQSTTGTKITMYAYDALNRLTSWTAPGGTPNTYNYDAASNRLAIVATSTTNYTYDIDNRMTGAGAAVLTSDNNGNLLNDGALTYTYDALNRLKSVKGTKVNAAYQYDGLGRRVQQNAGATLIHYVNDPVTGQVLTESGTSPITYFYGMGRVSAAGASEIYYQYDGSQNVASVTGSTGTLATNYTYQAWGQAKASVAGVVNRYQFASEAVDLQTGFIYMGGRYYRPSFGRFFSQGTLGGSPNDYVYQGSNPVR